MSLKELLGMWAERDSRYSYRKMAGTFIALSDREGQSVRWWRRREADMLAGDDRGIALLELSRWSPPTYSI